MSPESARLINSGTRSHDAQIVQPIGRVIPGAFLDSLPEPHSIILKTMFSLLPALSQAEPVKQPDPAPEEQPKPDIPPPLPRFSVSHGNDPDDPPVVEWHEEENPNGPQPPRTTSDTSKFRAAIGFLDSRDRLHGGVRLLNTSKPAIRPGGQRSVTTTAALPLHGDAREWYKWSSECLNKPNKLGTPYYPPFVATASQQYCNKSGVGSFLGQPREPPEDFLELSTLTTTADLTRVAANKPCTITTLKAIDSVNRVGVGASSYAHFFMDGGLGENETIRRLSQDREQDERTLLRDIHAAACAQYHFLYQAKTCSNDALGCAVAIDTNLTLQRRDGLLQHVQPTFERFTPQLRSCDFMQRNLLPATTEILSATDTDTYVNRQLMKSMQKVAERTHPPQPTNPKRKSTPATPKKQQSKSYRTPERRRFQTNDEPQRTGGSSGGRGARQGNTTPRRGGGTSRGAKTPNRGGGRDNWKRNKSKSKSPTAKPKK